MKQYECLFKSYNNAFSAGMDKWMENGENPDDIEMYVKRYIDKWENTVFNELDKKTPIEYINSIDDIEKAVELFIQGGIMCDMHFPFCIIKKLESFGEEIYKKIISIAFDESIMNDKEKYPLSITAINVLSYWDVKKALVYAMEIVEKETANDELFGETIKNVFCETSCDVNDLIADKLNSCNEIKNKREYLLMALSENGVKKPSDKIYQCIKKCFNKTENKVLAAYCLEKYGDSKAVPMLRTYIINNGENMADDNVYDILSSISNLGGQIEDIIMKLKKSRLYV